MQQGDVLLLQGLNDGDINVVGGIVEMTDDLQTAILLSMFGGNEDDSGQDQKFSWWGNFSENESEKTYRSETQFLAKKLPATTFNRARIESAALRDLNWFIENQFALSVNVVVTLPGGNIYRISGVVETAIKSTAFELDINGGIKQ